MSRFNRNGVNLKGKKLTEWVEQDPTVTAEETPTADEQEDSPPDTGQEPTPAPKPQGKKRNKRSK